MNRFTRQQHVHVIVERVVDDNVAIVVVVVDVAQFPDFCQIFAQFVAIHADQSTFHWDKPPVLSGVPL
jgi:hypothetical protein